MKVTRGKNGGEENNPLAEGSYVIFDGYYTGTGWSRTRENTSFSVHLIHWLDDLNCSSTISGNHPYWFVEMETIANAQSWPLSEFESLYNSASDISSTGGQMPRLLGLAQASKIVRNKPELQKYLKNNVTGNEVAFGMNGDASTSEGVFLGNHKRCRRYAGSNGCHYLR